MSESTTVTVGRDVHARSIRFAAVRADELVEERTLPYDEEQLERLLQRWPSVRCCYEAGPTGFGLYRHLVERGIDCAVVAPGLVPQRPGGRVKTDPRDARKLARLHAGGLLEPIHVPSPELEAARDLVRAREDARLDRMRDRHRLSKFCLRHGRLLPTSGWTVLRRKWLGEQRFEHAAEQEPWRELVARLRCLRGIDTLTALGLVAKIGDFVRFKTAAEFMAFVGLLPSEHSSGERRRQGSITKVGNAHGRRRPTVGYELSRRQRGQDTAVIERAWRCQRPRARRLRLGDRNRPTTQESPTIKPLGLEQRMRPATRRTLAGSMRHRPPVTRDLRQRQLPTVPSHAVPTRECQSDPPSLLQAERKTTRPSLTP